MGDFSFSAWGMRFFIGHMCLGFLLFILSLVPADFKVPVIAPNGTAILVECYYAPLSHGTMGMVFAIAILSMIANGVWAFFQKYPLCRWSGLEFAGKENVYDEGTEIVTVQARCFLPKLAPTIVFSILFFIGAVVAAATTDNAQCGGKPVGVWVSGSFFAFMAFFAYLAETVVICKWPSSYNSFP